MDGKAWKGAGRWTAVSLLELDVVQMAAGGSGGRLLCGQMSRGVGREGGGIEGGEWVRWVPIYRRKHAARGVCETTVCFCKCFDVPGSSNLGVESGEVVENWREAGWDVGQELGYEAPGASWGWR